VDRRRFLLTSPAGAVAAPLAAEAQQRAKVPRVIFAPAPPCIKAAKTCWVPRFWITDYFVELDAHFSCVQWS